MAPSTISVRLASKWLIAISVFVSAVLGWIVVHSLPLQTPGIFRILLGGMVLAWATILVLLARGVIPYLKASPSRVTHMQGFPNRITFRKIELHPGDALVVARGELFIWRHHSGQYDQSRVGSNLANPQDWKQFEEWVAARWPQPPDYSHQRAVIE